mgnify:CR=1 FL=1
MRLALTTYNLAADWHLAKIIETAKRCGFAGLDFTAECGHKHGVELETTSVERRRVREQVEDAYLEVACVGTSSRFEDPDAAKRRAAVDRTKGFLELAVELGSKAIRVVGNEMPAGVQREDCITYVGESLRVLGEFAESLGVDVLLETHGDFNFWAYARRAVEIADHPRVGILYNCDPRDVVGGSIAAAYGQLRAWVRYIHMHEYTGYWGRFPYPELFALLKVDGYGDYLGSEIVAADPSAEQFLAMYTVLFRAWAGQQSFTVPDVG